MAPAVTVLLWGAPEDAVVTAVASALATMGATTVIADGSDIVTVGHGDEMTTRQGIRLPLAAVTGVLVRPSGTGELANYGALAGWTELTPAVVLNRLSAGASNRSKPYQLRWVMEAGFSVPDTLVTTDPGDVRAFRAEHRDVIYKSTSGVRSIVNLLKPGDESRLNDVCACPTQFQQYISGIDHRVHVVGEDLFAACIDSDAVDYRYATARDRRTRMRSVTLPPDIASKCLALTTTIGLGLAGIDLRLDAEGRWWCFEVNTSPGFIWFEQQTDQPISAAVARMLIRPSASM